MMKTHSQRAVEARVLNDLRLAFKIDEIREAVFGQQGYDAVLLETRANYEGKADVEKGEEMNRVEEIINEDRDIVLGLLKACGVVGHTGCFKCFVGSASCKVDPLLWISMVSTSGCAKADEVDLVGHLSPVIGVGDKEDIVTEMVEWPRLKGSRVEYPTVSSRFREFFILVCETLNERWAASSSERRITAKDFLEYYAVKYVTATDGAYLSSSSSRPCFFDLSSVGRVWNDNLLWVSGECLQRSDKEALELNNRTITKGINCKVSRKESFIDAVAREDTELEAVLKELFISRFNRVASKDDMVRRSQAKRRMAGKTPGSMEEKLETPELNTPLKLARLNEMPDSPVDMATVSSTVVVLEESDKIAEGADLRPPFEVEAGLLEEQCRAKAREKIVAVMDDEFKKFAHTLKGVQLGFEDRPIELEKRISQLEREKNQLEENLTWEREAFQLELEKVREAAALKL
ncbi:hypothetical protein GIB67_027229 [Kingdonia uniflora]|uniref:Uncharacterized protein n=1 Tax=Kingdonia uniflora TaxID=39325 RepID=A0A7J7KYA2_9MAGN|nr:hypothetical protein GIB67_027229 [Kingdonia uniflora]